jgi:hypothetical protein
VHDTGVGISRARLQRGGDRRFGDAEETHAANPNLKRPASVGPTAEWTLADGMNRPVVTKGQPFPVN